MACPHVRRTEELFEDATAELEAERYAAAEEKFRRLLPLQERVNGMEHEATLNTRTMLATSLQCLRRDSEAEDILRDVLQIKQQSPEFGMEHHSTLISVTHLGNCLMNQERWKEAELMLRTVHAIHMRVLGPLAHETLIIQVTLGDCLMLDNQLEEAEGLLRGVYEAYQNQVPTLHLPRTMLQLVKCLMLAERHAEAEPLCSKAVEHARHTFVDQGMLTITGMALQGDVLRALGRYAEAEVVLKLALQGSQAARGWTVDFTPSMWVLACCMVAQGKAQPAEALVRDTLSRVQQDLGEAHPTTIEWMRRLGQVLQQVGKGDEAKALRSRAKKLAKQLSRARQG